MREIEILEIIYLNPGIHLREICRVADLGIPAVKNHIDKLLENRIIIKKNEGRKTKFYVNFNNRRTIPYLIKVESRRLERLPKPIAHLIFDFLKELKYKPVMTIIFGSYAKNDYTEKSDLDLLLVFNKVEKNIEKKIKLVDSRYQISLNPVYLTWEEFREKFFDMRDVFIREIKEGKIIVTGMEYWVMLENEKA